jgi:hypothetical protein
MTARRAAPTRRNSGRYVACGGGPLAGAWFTAESFAERCSSARYMLERDQGGDYRVLAYVLVNDAVEQPQDAKAARAAERAGKEAPKVRVAQVARYDAARIPARPEQPA